MAVSANDESLRTLADFGKTIPTAYISATIAYATYLSLVSASPNHSVEIFELIAFILFPTLPVIQFLDNAIQLVLRWVQSSEPQDLSFRYIFMGLCGCYVKPEGDSPVQWHDRKRVFEADPGLLYLDKKTWNLRILGKLIATLSTLVLGVLSLVNYGHRTNLDQSLYLDHRIGWMAIGATAASLMALIVQLCYADFTIATDETTTRTKNFFYEKGVFLEIIVAALVQDFLLDVVFWQCGVSWFKIVGDILTTISGISISLTRHGGVFTFLIIGIVLSRCYKALQLNMARLVITMKGRFARWIQFFSGTAPSAALDKPQPKSRAVSKPLFLLVLLLGLCVPIFQIVGEVKQNTGEPDRRPTHWREPDLLLPGL